MPAATTAAAGVSLGSRRMVLTGTTSFITVDMGPYPVRTKPIAVNQVKIRPGFGETVVEPVGAWNALCPHS